MSAAGPAAGDEAAGGETPTDGAATAAPHVDALDGVRGLALLAVFAFHFIAHGPGEFAWPAWVRTPALAGWAGVDLFFVLSGFLITRILLAHRGRPGGLRVFYVRRALRIFPVYYAMLFALSLGLQLASRLDLPSDEARHLLALWLYLTNFDIAAQGWGAAIFRSVQFAHLWTLAIEEQFYLVWPLLILFAPRRLLMPACVAVLIGAAVARWLLLRSGADPVAVYVLTYCRADTLAWGAAAALAIANWPARRIHRGTLAVGTIGLLATSSIVAVGRTVNEYDPLIQSAGFSAVAATFAAMIVWLTQPTCPLRRPLSNALLRRLGRYSYGAYLFHIPLRGLASLIWRSGLHEDPLTLSLPKAAITTGALTLGTLCLAALSYHFFERHFLRLKPALPPRN